MNLLLDTHAVLWFTFNDEQMPISLKTTLERIDCTKFVSIASVWDIAIKISIGKLTLSAPIEIFIPALFQRNGFLLLPISISHTMKVATLPFHHKDPFDRILIAQSLTESMPIVSSDEHLDVYGVERRWK